MDTSFDSILWDIHVTVVGARDRVDGCPEGLLDDPDQFIVNVNVARKSDPGFVDSLRQAVKGNNGELCGPVLMHDVFYAMISDNFGHMSDFAVPPKLQEEAVTRSWWTLFVGNACWKHSQTTLLRKEEKKGSYDPFYSIVQSSGMGKSRLVDEFSKTNFLIPIDLRQYVWIGPEL
ncbi:hypothetical protein EDB87DRAFT_1599957 [Lactarius vividus]|nr:hypothetical protein EDB87DRAFT_1599957 [Lactarius vividus]